MNKSQFIFGYGSLIAPTSRAKTVSDLPDAIPAVVSGIQRIWNYINIEMYLAALGIEFRSSSNCNGVIIPVDDLTLEKYDRREVNYSRFLVPPQSITDWTTKKNIEGQVWIYGPKSPQSPTTQCPIVQSYVDVVLTGALNIGNDYASELINSTEGWNSGHWINDRNKPVYRRSNQDNYYIDQIDKLLELHVPQAFQRRTLIR